MSRNLAASTVATPPSPATSGLTVTVQAGTGTLFSAGPVVLWPPDVAATTSNAEVATISSVSGDVLTLSARGAEGSTARAVASGWQVGQGLTAGAWDAVLTRLTALEVTGGSGGPVNGIDGGDPSSTFDGTDIDGGTP
jgi:hypothetical protein